MVNKVKTYAIAATIAALTMGAAHTSWAVESGPVDILQKIEQSEMAAIYTPIITGLKDSDVEFDLNQMLASDIQRGMDKFLLKLNQPTKNAKFIADYSEKYNRNGILSITIQQYSVFEKVHPEKSMNAYTVDLNTGKVYSLFQIFRPFVDYNTRLEQFIKDESIQRHAKYSIKHLKDTQPFYLTEEGLVIFFQPYELSAKQDNVVRFVIPYETMRDILNPELLVN